MSSLGRLATRIDPKLKFAEAVVESGSKACAQVISASLFSIFVVEVLDLSDAVDLHRVGAAEGERGGGGGDGDDAETDALYDEAVQFVLESRRASISAVQRKLKNGYNRPAPMVGAPATTATPRASGCIWPTRDPWAAMMARSCSIEG